MSEPKKKYGVNELREMYLSFFESKGICGCPAFLSSRRMTRACC